MTQGVSAALGIHLLPVVGSRVTVLGSTGSIGTATLDVIRFARELYGPGAFPLQALTAQRNAGLLASQAREFRPQAVVIGDSAQKSVLADALAGTGIRVSAGKDAVIEAAQHPSEMVVSAIVGAANLAPALEAAKRGAIVALANKECVVAARRGCSVERQHIHLQRTHSGWILSTAQHFSNCWISPRFRRSKKSR